MKARLFTILLITLAVVKVLFPTLCNAQNDYAHWGKKGHVTTVNPVVRSSVQPYLSLSGQWDFLINERLQMRQKMLNPDWGIKIDWSQSRKINVPGPWEVQGVGEPGKSHFWDPVWDHGDWDMKHVYMGGATYRRFVEIPPEWAGKQIWLKIGGLRSEAWIWVNSNNAAYVNNYCAAERFNITEFVKPGEKAEVIAFIRNDSPSRKGLFAANHKFGGFYRDVELEATADTWFEDLCVRGDFDTRSAIVKYAIHMPKSNKSHSHKLQIVVKSQDGKKIIAQRELPVAPSGKVSLPLPECRLWSPEEPNLYIAHVSLLDENNTIIYEECERFGVRKFEVQGNRFFLNGKPYFLRGSGDHHYDCINIIEPPDRDTFRKHISIYKSAGFNFMRFHTHCPLPEYCEIADELGLMLQPELPYYGDVPCETFPFDPLRDMKELFLNYRRHVSYAVLSGGNEGHLGQPLDIIMYQWVKENDPDRLVLHQDGGYRNEPGNSDFTTGPIRPWVRGTVRDKTRPFIAHEYLNLAIKMDPRLEPRFTGVRVAPVTMEKFRALLKSAGLNDEWGFSCLLAQGKLQGILQKSGLESARLDPECDGYSYWSIVDASIPQGPTVAAQGYLNSFWEIRPGGTKPQDFYRFNGPTALLLDLPNDERIFEAGKTYSLPFHISHYDKHDLAPGELHWTIADAKRTYVSGRLPLTTIKTGYAGQLGIASLLVPALATPARAKLTVSIPGTPWSNNWDVWLFPKREQRSLAGCMISKNLVPWFMKYYKDVVAENANEAKPTDLFITSDAIAAGQAASSGRNVLLIHVASQVPNVSLGWWMIGTQVGMSIRNHACFGDFPNTPWMDELWFRLVKMNAPDLVKRDTWPEPLRGSMEPIIVGEGRDSYYLYLGKFKSGKGSILASFALDLTQDKPESLALLDRLIDFARSGR